MPVCPTATREPPIHFTNCSKGPNYLRRDPGADDVAIVVEWRNSSANSRTTCEPVGLGPRGSEHLATRAGAGPPADRPGGHAGEVWRASASRRATLTAPRPPARHAMGTFEFSARWARHVGAAKRSFMTSVSASTAGTNLPSGTMQISRTDYSGGCKRSVLICNERVHLQVDSPYCRIGIRHSSEGRSRSSWTRAFGSSKWPRAC